MRLAPAVRTAVRLLTLAVMCVCGVAATVSAQVPQVPGGTGGGNQPQPAEVRRPYRGLFGGPISPDTPQSLVLGGSLYGGYDDNVAAGATGTQGGNKRLQQSGSFLGGAATLAYSLQKVGERSTFSLGSGLQLGAYAFDGDNYFVPNGHVEAGFSTSLSQRTRLSASHAVIYTYNQRFLLFPALTGEDDDGALIGDPDLEVYQRSAVRQASNVNLSYNINSRASLHASYTYGTVNFTEGSNQDWHRQHVTGGYQQRLTEHATLHLGYGYHTSTNNDVEDGSNAVQDINAGVSYSRALSISRRTSISFGTGTAISSVESLDDNGGTRQRLHMLGNVALNHEIGRTWTAQAAYRRGFIFREEFNEPFFTDAASVSVGGLVNRRVSLSAQARWSFSRIDQSGRNHHKGVAASATANYAINRFVAAFARYVYYQYDFGEDIVIETGLPRALDRQGVRVGLTATLPLIR